MADIVESADQIAAHAAEGRVPKHVLVTLLAPEKRREFLEACAAIEQRYTETCRASGDPCLASGCSMEAENICLDPLLRAGDEYYRACAAEFTRLAGTTQR